jgi:hypothetical protein
MPLYKVQREYTNWEQTYIEAEDKDEALLLAENEEHWENAYDVNSYNFTGEIWVGEENE